MKKELYSIVLIEKADDKRFFNIFSIQSNNLKSYMRNWKQRHTEILLNDALHINCGMDDYDWYGEFPNGLIFGSSPIFTTLKENVKEKDREDETKLLIYKHLKSKVNSNNQTLLNHIPFGDVKILRKNKYFKLFTGNMKDFKFNKMYGSYITFNN